MNIDASTVLTELYERYESNPNADEWWPGDADVARWTDGTMAAEHTLLNEVAAELARGYAAGRYSYEFGDGVANGLWAVLINGLSRPGAAELPWPSLFNDVYDAFDGGEFRLAAEDPIETRTKPWIAEIVARL